MLENTIARKKRRPVILKGISQDLKHSEIADQLRANRGLIMSDIKLMRRNGDLGLKKAEKAQVQAHEKKVLLIRNGKKHFKQNERFLRMTGITLQQKSFRNMIDFNKRALMNILRSEDQNSAIMRLSKNIRKTMRRNGIITKRWKDNEITEHAQEYLTTKKSCA